LISFVSGLLILFSMIQIQANERTWEVNMLKIFGANQRELLRYLLTSILVIVGLALFLGNLVSAAVSGILSYQLFSTSPSFDLQYVVLGVVAVLGIVIFMTLYSLRRLILGQPVTLLRGGPGF